MINRVTQRKSLNDTSGEPLSHHCERIGLLDELGNLFASTGLPMPTQRSQARSKWIAVLLTLGFAVLFLLLHSQQYLAVDGPLRCLEILHNPAVRFHGNNHMLYPFWIRAWTRAAASLGFTITDWSAFIRLCQAMNTLAGATAIGLLFCILESVAGPGYALLGALQFGLSTAVVLHSTNSAEPVVGLMFSLAALYVLISALRAESKLRLCLVGLLLALALASYQSMALVAPLIAFACVCWPRDGRQVPWRLAMSRLLMVGLGGLLSVVTIYGLAYSSQGVPPSQMPARFLAISSSELYGGFSVSKSVNAPLGLVHNLFDGLPSEYAGIRSLPATRHRVFWITEILVSNVLLSILAWMILSGIGSAVRRSKLSKPLVWSGIALSLLSIGFPLVYWAPTYDKLWLQPLAVIAIIAAFSLRFGNFDARQYKILMAALALLVAIEAAVNIPRAVRDHLHETAHLNEAREFAGLLRKGDSVVIDFDDVSMLWLAIWSSDTDTLVLPTSTRTQAAVWLSSAERKEAAKLGRLFFIGVLDHDKQAWDAFMALATRIPYAEFECYRQNSVIIRQFPFPRRPVTVRQLVNKSCGLRPEGNASVLASSRD
jgi:hypothetical protein